MSKTISLAELEEKLAAMRESRQKLDGEIAFLEKAKELLFTDGAVSQSRNTHRAMSLDDILKDAFQSNPSKKYYADDIAALLADKRREGIFTANARNLRRYAGPALRRLVEESFVRQGGREENPWWEKT